MLCELQYIVCIMALSDEEETEVYKIFIDYVVNRIVQHESCRVYEGMTEIQDVAARSRDMDNIGVYDFAIVYEPTHLWGGGRGPPV